AYADNQALTLALKAHIGAVFEVADATLLGLATRLQQRGDRVLANRAELSELLQSSAHGAAMLYSLFVVSPDGTPLASSNDAHHALLNMHERESVRAHYAPH